MGILMPNRWISWFSLWWKKWGMEHSGVVRRSKALSIQFFSFRLLTKLMCFRRIEHGMFSSAYRQESCQNFAVLPATKDLSYTLVVIENLPEKDNSVTLVYLVFAPYPERQRWWYSVRSDMVRVICIGLWFVHVWTSIPRSTPRLVCAPLRPYPGVPLWSLPHPVASAPYLPTQKWGDAASLE